MKLVSLAVAALLSGTTMTFAQVAVPEARANAEECWGVTNAWTTRLLGNYTVCFTATEMIYRLALDHSGLEWRAGYQYLNQRLRVSVPPDVPFDPWRSNAPEFECSIEFFDEVFELHDCTADVPDTYFHYWEVKEFYEGNPDLFGSEAG